MLLVLVEGTDGAGGAEQFDVSCALSVTSWQVSGVVSMLASLHYCSSLG